MNSAQNARFRGSRFEFTGDGAHSHRRFRSSANGRETTGSSLNIEGIENLKNYGSVLQGA
jgi:hypothetical protein